jgi:redox-sensitive bicupin YhaK (pirin superfamily)
MNYIRPAAERGSANFGWLDSKHTFSFGNYYDPNHMGFSTLRVINDDRVAPGGGFPPHGHRDMEIISVVLQGCLAHKDSMGNGSTIVPGDVQRMSAGTGIRHSEYNGSDSDPVHFLQIWILPGEEGIEPGYEQKHFSRDHKLGKSRLIASRDGREGSLTINQDANLYNSILPAGQSLTHIVHGPRQVWIHTVSGELTANGTLLQSGDGLGLVAPRTIELSASSETELLIFELESNGATK